MNELAEKFFYDHEKFCQALIAAKERKRDIRLVDVLATSRDVLRAACEAGVTLREIHSALQKASFHVEFSYFAKTFKDWRRREGIKLRREFYGRIDKQSNQAPTIKMSEPMKKNEIKTNKKGDFSALSAPSAVDLVKEGL